MKEEDLVFLGNYNLREAVFIESLLRSYDIHTVRKYLEAGGYLEVYMGCNFFGVEIYVPSDKLEIAREVIQTKQEE